jgi:hypothetical protein
MVKSYTTLLVILARVIELARNASLFEDRKIVPLQSASEGLRILKNFPQLKWDKISRKPHVEVVNREDACAFLDGAT